MEVKNVKGTKDVFGDEVEYVEYIESAMKSIASVFNFEQLRIPVLEHSEVFVRGVGEGSDVVRKEMYTFDDKGGRSLTLRPEFTAGIIRSIVQNKMYATMDLPIKKYYLGPVFRYERPQLGRYRQFNQFGVELVGVKNILNEIDVIRLGYTILRTLGLDDVKILINTLGDEESRNAYKVALKEYFKDHIEHMCPDCKSRYEVNPLRILDCKVKEDREIIKDCPKISSYLSQESNERFDKVLKYLDALNIPYEIDDNLVRGLDYYSETVFEFHYTSKKGINYGAIGAGGHYDKLVSEFGGPQLDGVGFSFGVERVLSVLTDDGFNSKLIGPIDVYVLPLDEGVVPVAYQALPILQAFGYRCEINLDGTKLGTQIKKAVKHNARFAVIIGEDEVLKQCLVLKNLETGEQQEISVEDFFSRPDAYLDAHEHECHCGSHDDCDCDGDCDCDCDCEEDDHHCCCHHHKEEN